MTFCFSIKFFANKIALFFIGDIHSNKYYPSNCSQIKPYLPNSTYISGCMLQPAMFDVVSNFAFSSNFSYKTPKPMPEKK